MDQERVSRLDVDWWWPEHMLATGSIMGNKDRSRPRAIDTNNASWKEAIWVCVLDVGEVPPYLLNTSECWASQRNEQDKCGRQHGENGKRGSRTWIGQK